MTLGFHALSIDELRHVLRYLCLRDLLRLCQANRDHHRLLLTDGSLWRTVYTALWRENHKISVPIQHSWKETLDRYMRAQTNWRHGRVTACIHQLNLNAPRRGQDDQPLQALQFRVLRSAAFGSPQVLAAGKGSRLHICAYEDYTEGPIRGHYWRDAHSFHAHQGTINAIRMQENGVVTASADRTVKIYDWHKDDLHEIAKNQDSPVWGLDVDVDHHIIATSGYRWLQLRDIRTSRPPVSLAHAHESWVRTLQLLTHRHLVITGSRDGQAAIWDLRKGCGLLLSLGHDTREEVRSIQVSRDRVVTGCHDGRVRAWDMTTGDMTELLSAGDHPIECIQACDKKVVSVDWQGNVSCVLEGAGMQAMDSVVNGRPSHKRTTVGRTSYRLKVKNRSSLGLNVQKEDTTQTTSNGTNAAATAAGDDDDGGMQYDDDDDDEEEEGVSMESDGFVARQDEEEEEEGNSKRLLSPRVLSMQYDESRLIMGRHDGSIVELTFDQVVRPSLIDTSAPLHHHRNQHYYAQTGGQPLISKWSDCLD